MATYLTADNVGPSLSQLDEVLEHSSRCWGEGALNGVALSVTGNEVSQCTDRLRPLASEGIIFVGFHLNLTSGICCADPATVPLLVDRTNHLKLSFRDLRRLTSIGKDKDQYRWQVRKEAEAQLVRYLELMPSQRDCLRISSERHVHLIPAVFDGLLEAAGEQGCTIQYLRIPAEPLLPLLTTPTMWKHTSASKVRRALSLKFMWRLAKEQFPAYQQLSAIYCGTLLDHRMGHIADDERYLAKLAAKAQRKGMSLELSFQPTARDLRALRSPALKEL